MLRSRKMSTADIFLLFRCLAYFSLSLSLCLGWCEGSKMAQPTHYPPAISKVVMEILLSVHECECAYAPVVLCDPLAGTG